MFRKRQQKPYQEKYPRIIVSEIISFLTINYLKIYKYASDNLKYLKEHPRVPNLYKMGRKNDGRNSKDNCR